MAQIVEQTEAAQQRTTRQRKRVSKQTTNKQRANIGEARGVV
jgi:hypothetical protein